LKPQVLSTSTLILKSGHIVRVVFSCGVIAILLGQRRFFAEAKAEV
jgi:hypothetical protein